MKAFPSNEPIYGDDIVGIRQSTGMDLRDYFAVHATEHDVAEYMWQTLTNTGRCTSKVQIRSREQARYVYADAMMKARSE